MPHGVKMPKLGRDTAHRMAMLRNMVTSLFKYERIETTTAKAKALRRVADDMITKGKEGTLDSFIRINGFVRERPIVNKVMVELAERYKYRPGGFTRVIRTRRRRGDFAEMAYIELVDREGEMRPARKCDLDYALAKGFVDVEDTRYSPLVFGEGDDRKLKFVTHPEKLTAIKGGELPPNAKLRAQSAKESEAIFLELQKKKEAERKERFANKK